MGSSFAERIPCVAVTAAGSGIGQTVIDGLRACPFPVRIVGFELSGYTKGVFDCDAAHCLPSPDNEDYVGRLVALCEQEAVDLLIPGSDSELPKIAEAAASLQQVGSCALCSPTDSVRTLQDKKLLYDYMTERHAPFFLTLLARDVATNPAAIAYPAIAKPRWGSGSVGIQILAGPSDWDWILPRYTEEELEALIVQPLGRPESWNQQVWERVLKERRMRRQDQIAVQLFYGRSEEVIGRMSWLVRLKDGVVMTIEVVDDSGVWEAVDAVERAVVGMGIRGPFNLQGIWTGKDTTFFEVNPRFSGSTGVRSLLGYREIEAAVRHYALGETEELVRDLVKPGRAWIGLRQMAERIVPSSWVHGFERDGRFSFPRPLERIVMTGGSGYLGLQLVQTLAARQPTAEIVLPVRDPDRALALLRESPISDRLSVLPWEEFERLSPAVAGDVLIHLAAVRPPVAESEPLSYVQNLHLAGLAAKAARTLSIPLFVLLSSHAVYEGSEPPWTEDTPPHPRSVYAYAKVACEEIVRELSNHGTRYGILRMASLYGVSARMEWGRVIHRFASQAVRGLPIELHGDGSQTMDLVHVGDAAKAVACLLEASDQAWNRAYNITSNQPVSVAALAELCCRIAREGMGLDASVRRVYVPARSSSYGSNTRLAEDLLKWTPDISLEQGVLKIMKYAQTAHQT
jgi:nucleoside-diphosphate-sugar epimerase/carbamoylphosphate synthase large subunit